MQVAQVTWCGVMTDVGKDVMNMHADDYEYSYSWLESSGLTWVVCDDVMNMHADGCEYACRWHG